MEQLLLAEIRRLQAENEGLRDSLAEYKAMAKCYERWLSGYHSDSR